MTDEQIVKALECCGHQEECTICPLDDMGGIDKCLHTLLLNALDLINRQKAEIEEKDIEIDILIRKKESLCDEISELKAEVERLEKILDKRCDVCPAVTTAIKDFAYRLKESFRKNLMLSSYVRKMVDDLVKEMVGD